MPPKRNKVPKRISILAADKLAELPELQELAEKGHVVVPFSDYQGRQLSDDLPPTLDEFDLILSDSACAYAPGMEKYLADMVKGARARRYGVAKGLETEI